MKLSTTYNISNYANTGTTYTVELVEISDEILVLVDGDVAVSTKATEARNIGIIKCIEATQPHSLALALVKTLEILA